MMVDELKDEDIETISFSDKERAGKYAQFYSNFAECGITPWDIRLLFSQTGESGIVKMATVIMTPAMAKALVGLLNVNIKIYERDNGEIKMPQSLVREQQAKAKASASPSPSASASPSPEPPEDET